MQTAAAKAKDPQRLSALGVFNRASGADSAEQDNTPKPKELTLDEKMLLAMSGQVIDRQGLRNTARDAEEEERKAEEEKNFKRYAHVVSEGGFEFSVGNVVDSLTRSVELDQAFLRLNDPYMRVENKDMLRLDSRGNPVSAEDDPQGKFIVRTIEEKRAYEDRIGACTARFSQDEVERDENGGLVSVRANADRANLVERIGRSQDTIKGLRDGTIDPANLDPAMRDEILERHRASQDTSLKGANLLDQLAASAAPEAPVPQAPAMQQRVFAPMAQPGL